MKTSLLILAVGGLFLAGCGDNSSSKSAPATNATGKYDTGNPLTEPADYMGAVMQADKYAVKQIDLSYLTQAIQQFNASEDRYPKDLNELLTEHYIGKIPDAPYGMKIVYDATSGTVKVVKQ